jgi:hypothetical protein
MEQHNKALENERETLRLQLAQEQTRVDKLKASIRAALEKQVSALHMVVSLVMYMQSFLHA